MAKAQGRGVVAPLVKLVVFLVVTAFATYVLGATIANVGYGDTYSYKADFSDASGLQVGDDVRIAGVRVGSITGVTIVNHNTARVSFSVMKSKELPSSTLAKLRYRNLVGQRYLDIQQGPGNSNAVLRPNSIIPESQTEPAVDLTVLFAGFKPLFEGLNADQINQLSGEIIKVLQGEAGSIELLLSTVADVTNTLADKDAVIGRVVDNLTTVVETVGSRDAQLSNLIVQLQGFVSGLAEDRSTIGNAIEAINGLTVSTQGLLAGVREPLKNDIVELTGLVATLNKSSDTIAYVLQQFPPTVAGLIRTASYGSWINFYLCSISGKITLPGGAQSLNLDLLPSTNSPRCNS